MERPIHRVRGCRRPQEPPPPIVHAAPQSWGDPLPRRRPQVGPGLAGRGEPAAAAWGWHGDKCSERECSPQRGARRARAPAYELAPCGRPGYLRRGHLLA